MGSMAENHGSVFALLSGTPSLHQLLGSRKVGYCRNFVLHLPGGLDPPQDQRRCRLPTSDLHLSKVRPQRTARREIAVFAGRGVTPTCGWKIRTGVIYRRTPVSADWPTSEPRASASRLPVRQGRGRVDMQWHEDRGLPGAGSRFAVRAKRLLRYVSLVPGASERSR